VSRERIWPRLVKSWTRRDLVDCLDVVYKLAFSPMLFKVVSLVSRSSSSPGAALGA